MLDGDLGATGALLPLPTPPPLALRCPKLLPLAPSARAVVDGTVPPRSVNV